MTDERPTDGVERFRGLYVGTEIDHKWWKRYREASFGWTGNGEFWIEADALWFRKIVSKAPLQIPLHAIRQVTVGKWHAGNWPAGAPIVKIQWQDGSGASLSSGFAFRDRELAQVLVDRLRSRSA